MGNTSTFGTFTMARLGIYVAQHALNVTGNNITNINTTGYTRRQLDQTSMFYGSADRYQSRYDIRANGGVLAQGVYQLRDQYLDIRYRNEATRVGEATEKLSVLQQLSNIFDEVAKGDDGDGVLEARLNDLIQQIENLSKPENSNKDDMDSIVRAAAEALTTQFHDYAKQLETLKQNMTAQFRSEVEATNTILTKIRNLNEEIRKSEVFGGSALTLRDERNLLIDELSGKMGIHVTYEVEDLGDGREVEKLKITTSGDPSRTLIDGIYGAQLTILNEKNYDLSIGQLRSSKDKLMPNQPNKTEKLLSGIDVSTDIVKSTTRFSSQADAEEMAKKLNGDTKYTVGNDGAKYTYEVKATGETPESWVIQRYDVSSGEKRNGAYVETLETPQTQLSDIELSGGLQAMREMMTEAGEYSTANDKTKTDELHYDPDAGVKRGIPYYMKALDTLAQTFADLMNKENMMQDEEIYQTDENGNLVTDADGYYIPRVGFEKFFERDENDESKYKENPDGPPYLLVKDEYKDYMGWPLFSNNANGDDPTGITAANISVSAGWESGAHRILRSKDPNADEQSTLQDNIDHILSMLMGKHEFKTESGATYFEGTFQEMFTDTISGTLAKDANITTTMLDNYSVTAEELYLNRDAVMGVDLNDETMNMMQFQKAYSAACRLMTTFDEMIDRLVNGTAM